MISLTDTGSRPAPALLPVVRAHELERRPPEATWLVESLWAREAVGILGGEPKCCKSLFALQLALAVASGRPHFGRFAVRDCGAVLVHPAEDAGHIVRDRLDRLAASAGIDLSQIPLYVSTAPSLRLDRPGDCDSLAATVAHYQPRLLILDPLVRLHHQDENVAAAIAPLLGTLREIQRTYHTAILVVHHARKGNGKSRAGQALRGSSEFHAWGDCNLYLRWRRQTLVLSAEHRAAAAPDDLALALAVTEHSLCLQPCDPLAPAATASATPRTDPAAAILHLLVEAGQPVRHHTIRQELGLRNQTITQSVNALLSAGRIRRTENGLLPSTPDARISA